MSEKNEKEVTQEKPSFPWKILIYVVAFVLLLVAGLSLLVGENNTPASSVGTDISAVRQVSDGQYFIWTIYDPDTDEVEGVLVRIDSNGWTTIMSEIDDDGEAEEMFSLSGSVASGSMGITTDDEDFHANGSFIENPDGTWTGLMDARSDEGYATSYTKLLPVTYVGGDNWKITTTGEILTYDDICYEDLSGTKAGSTFKKESKPFTSYTEYETKPTPAPTPSTVIANPNPVTGKKNNDVTISDDLMRVYVTYELETIEHEYQKANLDSSSNIKPEDVPVNQHIKMPNDTEQKRFESLLEAELHDEKLAFYLKHKKEWYH